jgi:hypothetical protein
MASVTLPLDQFKAEYEALNLSKMKMRSFMISLRDKCAHVRLGDGNDLYPCPASTGSLNVLDPRLALR